MPTNIYRTLCPSYNVSPEHGITVVGYYYNHTTIVLEGLHSEKRWKPHDLFASGTAYTYTHLVYDDIPLICVADEGNYRSYRPASDLVSVGSFGKMDPPDIRTALRLKIKDAGANILQNVGEGRELVGLLSKAARFAHDVGSVLRNPKKLLSDTAYQGVKKSLEEFRTLSPTAKKAFGERARRARNGRPFKNAADAQLTWNFGIAPLLDDIKDAKRRFAEKIGDSSIGEKFVSCSRNDHRQRVQLSGFNTRFGQLYAEATEYVTVRAKARIRVQTDLALAKEFGLTNPFSAAYELIPFSFVVDELFNIGDTLSALDAGIGVQDVAWYTTTKHTEDTTSNLGSKYHSEDLYRSGVSSVLEFGQIEYKPSRSLKTLANDLALLASFRSKAYIAGGK